MSGKPVSRGFRWTSERRFHTGFTLAILAAVLLGFSRTFFLRRWFPEWADAHGAPEPFFLFHGAVFFAWFLLLLVQPTLVAARRVDVHRRLGWLGAGLAAAMIVLGTVGALIAARAADSFWREFDPDNRGAGIAALWLATAERALDDRKSETEAARHPGAFVEALRAAAGSARD